MDLIPMMDDGAYPDDDGPHPNDYGSHPDVSQCIPMILRKCRSDLMNWININGNINVNIINQIQPIHHVKVTALTGDWRTRNALEKNPSASRLPPRQFLKRQSQYKDLPTVRPLKEPPNITSPHS